ncbi:hypothetical protein Pan216_23990 [Planctomycetes bacterium Pan216]|uniref:Sugar O-methyltransferase n=1 Tax=Kolteria novifilia TaxID=2527975 RepID=A0A518B3H0_9BACT|nr:hypothetical protein Pan216_23990 [Planctomycetes bacterium Pan216]
MIKNAFDPEPHLSESSLEKGLADRTDQLPDALHRGIVERVARMYQHAKEGQRHASGPYRIGGEWASFYEERERLYEPLRQGDIDASLALLRGFWRNELGPLVKEYARFEQLVAREEPATSRFQAGVVRNYLIWNDLVDASPESLRIPDVGNPWGYVIDGVMVAPKATRFHALSTQAQRLVSDAERPWVLEIGAGYGGMAYYLLRDRADVTYVDFDLPETLVLAAYYLLCCLPDRRHFLYGEGEIPWGERSGLASLLLPNFALASVPERSAALVVNSFSLSEMPRGTLAEYCDRIGHITDVYFWHNNVDRWGVVNRGHERIPASAYPLDESLLSLVSKHFDQFHGHGGDYREYLYRRVEAHAQMEA